MPEIEIRPATANDLTVLATIDHSYQTDHVWQMDRHADITQVRVSFREIRLPRTVLVEYPRPVDLSAQKLTNGNHVFVAALANEPVGYVRLSEGVLPGAAWVLDMAVHPDLRRKGIATALLLAAQEWASAQDFRSVICEMQSKNFPAICLMLKLGYKFCGYNEYYYENQDIALFFAHLLR